MINDDIEAVSAKLNAATHNASNIPPPWLGPGPGPFPGYYKTSYVTADLNATASRFFATFGCSSFSRTGRHSVDLGDNESADIEVATAWAGAIQLELIQPIVDETTYYSALLPRGGSRAALHHLGRLFESESEAAQAAERLRESGYSIRRIDSPSTGNCFRANFLTSVGHYVEGVVLDGAARNRLGKIPRMGLATGATAIMGPGPAPFPGFYQFTYITNDFDRAIAHFKDIHGIDNFLEIRPLEVPMTDGRLARMNCALTYVGAMEIEVMNPIDGDVSIYTDMMPPGELAIRHHHTSRLFTDYEKFEQRAEEFSRMGKRILGNNDIGAFDRSRFYYADCRDEVGHYLESSIFDGPTREWVNTIPRR